MLMGFCEGIGGSSLIGGLIPRWIRSNRKSLGDEAGAPLEEAQAEPSVP